MEDYIRNRLVAEAPSVPPLTPEERAAAFRAWADSHEPSGAPLSDEAISRESIYGERR